MTWRVDLPTLTPAGVREDLCGEFVIAAGMWLVASTDRETYGVAPLSRVVTDPAITEEGTDKPRATFAPRVGLGVVALSAHNNVSPR